MEVIQRQRERQWGTEEYKNNDTLRTPIAGRVNKTKEGYKRDYVNSLLNTLHFLKNHRLSLISLMAPHYLQDQVQTFWSGKQNLSPCTFSIFFSHHTIPLLIFLSSGGTKFITTAQKHSLFPKPSNTVALVWDFVSSPWPSRFKPDLISSWRFPWLS